MKYLILDTAKEFEAKEKEACKLKGLPKGDTARYANIDNCEIKVNGQIKYKYPHFEGLSGKPVDYNPEWEKHKRVE